jgi:hypothetical protein
MTEKTSVLRFKCQLALHDAVEKAAEADFSTKSSVVRVVLANELRWRGLLRVDFSEPLEVA